MSMKTCEECKIAREGDHNFKEVDGKPYCYICILEIVAYAMNEKVDDIIDDLYKFDSDFIAEMIFKRDQERKYIEAQLQLRRLNH